MCNVSMGVMPKKYACIAGICLIASSLACQAGGLTLGGTRLIYDARKKEASIPLSNSDNRTSWLIQVWVTDLQGREEHVPFVATPPLFKLGTSSDTTVRVAYTATPDLPPDKESVFLLNIRAVPSVEKKENPARLIIATQNIIKLIYRPSGLTSREAGLVWQKLCVRRTAAGIAFRNPTPYLATLSAMSIDGKKIERPGNVLPGSTVVVPVHQGMVHGVTFRTINDFGGLGPSRDVHF
ncbi:molecular chaperone [Salmonella enterica]|nr:molecular chaperone [Salmonella enterica]